MSNPESKRIQTITAGRLLVFPSSDRWASSILQIAKQEHVATKQFTSVDAMAEAVDSFQPCAVVLDFSNLPMGDVNRFLKAAGTPVFRSPLFAVGDKELCDFRLELVKAGFSEIFSSTGQTLRLIRLAKSYFQNAESVKYPIEEIVARDLPW